MITIKKNINQFVPRVIEFKNTLYIGFINEKETDNPTMYFKFMSQTFGLQELEKIAHGDKIYKISLNTYFKINSQIRGKYIYNLKKFKHELNNRYNRIL